VDNYLSYFRWEDRLYAVASGRVYRIAQGSIELLACLRDPTVLADRVQPGSTGFYFLEVVETTAQAVMHDFLATTNRRHDNR